MDKTAQAERTVLIKAWRWLKDELERNGGTFPDIPQQDLVKLMLGMMGKLNQLCVEHRDDVSLDDRAFPCATSDFAASVLWAAITFETEEEVERYANPRCLAGDLLQAFASAVMATEMIGQVRMHVHDADDSATFLESASTALEVGSSRPAD